MDLRFIRKLCDFVYFLGSMSFFSCTICPRSSDPFYIASYYIKWTHTTVSKKYCLKVAIRYMKMEKDLTVNFGARKLVKLTTY